MTKTETSNWFTDNLPYDIKGRHDGLFNVWHMRPFPDENNEPELKWYVAGVFDTESKARKFVEAQ